ncbi:4-hydroxy-tetrahydrodipicolinate synthase [Candidatus Neptunochlamydia vexilliferae]|uniref:4-hydroxy-tetrahydrodipicolinate synthase n=1 Tax=Candidatus Neptunichlamydia vexilliferae TaxID=1651774 RepID=A0ABS0AX30_9BACT|nr:4-hydroxy-tetrahydrodipicolinate synthase [Candidatus Neptunochlamydia vexilliferae]MBF5058692.1 4-hydroxy-tetrahydrodipicolinate synthase [Candidatus Neptunochlamydia vexilliferae]
MFKGVITALVTPFKEGHLDEQGFRENIWFQLEEGADALLALGTTGEGATLTPGERKRVIEILVEESKVPPLVEVGDNSTARAVTKIQEAEKMGVQGVLAIAPYYNRPTQEGLFRHFEILAAESSLPIILYNQPKRTGVSFTVETLTRLAEIKNIVGIKDASGSIPFAAAVMHALPNFLFFAGDDLMALPLMTIGATGVVSVLSNLMPQKMSEMVRTQDRNLYRELYPFMAFSQVETNPIPIKAMMEKAGLAAGECRLPLTPLSSENQQKVEAWINSQLVS